MNRKFLLLLIIFCLIQIPILFSSLTGDENVYYYMGKVVAEGETPYKDFFFGHPPSQIYLYAFLIKLFGLHIWILKSFTLLFITGSTIFLYLFAKERYDEKIALTAAFLFLASYDILIFGSFAFGIEIAVFFFMIALYLNNKKPFIAGLLFGFSIMIRLHLFPMGIILLLYSKERLKFLLGAGICLPYYGLLLRIPNFADNVFLYHASKLNHWNGWFSFLRANLPLFVLVSYSIKNIKDSFTFELTLAYCAFLVIVGSVFEYFFLPITIILSIEGAYALAYSRFRKWLWVMVVIWTAIMGVKVGVFIYEQTTSYNGLIDYVSKIDGSIMGEPPLASLIALKGNKNITRNMIDLNFQRREVFDYRNSLVIYNEKRFNGFDFNCTLINSTTIKEDTYKLWRC